MGIARFQGSTSKGGGLRPELCVGQYHRGGLNRISRVPSLAEVGERKILGKLRVVRDVRTT